MRRWLILALLAGVSCDDAPAGGPPVAPPEDAPSPEERAFLTSFDRDLVAPTYARMQAAAADLRAATDRWAAAPLDPAARDAAQAAWSAAMAVWQIAELLQVGPASASRAGAAGLRDEVYSWPSQNPCRVDQEVAGGDFAGPDFAQARLVNTYGLDALEYLLFVPGDANACPPQVPPNSDGAWSALGAEGIAAGRAGYAAAVAAQVERDVARLAAAWTPFAAELVGAGEGSAHYPSRQAAYDDIFAALFYLDLSSKDAKVGDVAGITAGCAAEACPENVESRWAGRDAAHLLANLRAAEAVLFGAAVEGAVGFTALLERRGASALVGELRAAVDDAIAVVEALDRPFATLVVDDPAALPRVYAAIKRITDLLKSQFATVLNLSVPAEGASDND